MKPNLLAAALATALSAPLAAQAVTIGVTMVDYNNPFRASLRNGVEDAAKKAGVTVQFEDARQDIGAQLSQVQNMVAQHVDAIIVQAVNTDATSKITRLASEARIPLIYINLKPADFDKLPSGVAVVASDEAVGGSLEAQQVCKLLGGRGNVLILMGDLAHEAARTRTQAVESFVGSKQCPGAKVVDKREGKWDRVAAMDITSNWLTMGTQFDAIVANNDEMALGAINALKAAKKLSPRMVVAGIDATPDALVAMKAGDLKVSVFQNAAAQGEGSVQAALKLIHRQPMQKFVNVPFELVTPDNLAKYVGKN